MGRLNQAVTGVAARIEARFGLVLAVVLVALGVLKSLSFLPTGRLWAEEGADFLAGMCALPAQEAATFLFNNHLQLLTNVGILLTRSADLAHAPAITTAYAAALQLSVFVLIAAKRHALGLPGWAVLAVVLVGLGLAQAREVWANTINLHFFGLLAAAVVLAVPATGARWIALSFAILLVAGLSGIPANLLVPLFVVVALVERSGARAAQAVTLALTAALQAALLLWSGYDGARGVSLRLDILLFATLTQSGWGLFLNTVGSKPAGQIFRMAFEAPSILSFALTAAFAGLSLWLLHRLVPVFRQNDPAARWRQTKLIGTAFYAAFACAALALEDRTVLVTAFGGGRYFWAPGMLFAVAFFAAGHWTRTRRVAAVLMLVLAADGLFFQFNGPDWNTPGTVEALADGTVVYQIWPRRWTMVLPPECTTP